MVRHPNRQSGHRQRHVLVVGTTACSCGRKKTSNKQATNWVPTEFEGILGGKGGVPQGGQLFRRTAMSLHSRYFAPLLIVGGGAVWIAAAPVAAADPSLPVAGSESASATIKDLKAQGYNVAINWVSGIPDVSLSQCWVNSINTADASSQDTLKTAYVDVECPK
jgi:hypothetical protein